MATQATLGSAALSRKDFPSAIKHYTSALSEAPTSPDYYIKRSTAYQRSIPPEHTQALRDAEAAVYHAHQRGKRELIATAQMRRGIALFGLRRWRDARKCFEWVKQRNEKEQGLAMWEMKVATELEKAGSGDGQDGEEVGVVEIPDVQSVQSVQSTEAQERNTEPATVAKGGEGVRSSSSSAGPARVAAAAGKLDHGVQTPADKIRHEWYQTSENVVVTLFVKGVPKDQATVEIQDQSISISFPMPNGSTYDFSLDPLFSTVDTETSTSSIMSTKIELMLKKTRPGQKWTSLESTQTQTQVNSAQQDSTAPSTETPTTDTTNSAPPLPAPAPAPSTKPKETAPSYPTSSRSGPKNWDKLATDLIKQSKKQEKKPTPEPTKDDYGDDDDDYDDDEVDPAHGFFKKLYASADPDTRRAMMKSYQESNGTALSTNWAEVGKGKVDTSPPQGMEARRWG
ncbi:MAG: hypothetical protein M1816_003672 [Peltula sp. TS41687]|nr:MAG: hypothetical protein M1816_003672 [Peltula sp. TS41687]